MNGSPGSGLGLWRPGRLRPMLARRVEEPFDSPDYLFEVKWDGYRCLAFVDRRVMLQSRGGRDMSSWFPEVAQALRSVGGSSTIVDGEIVAWRDHRPDFGTLQRRARRRGPAAGAGDDVITLVAFDLLAEGGRDLTGLPCEERRWRLRRWLESAAPGGPLLFSEEVVDTGRAFYAAVVEAGLEGIVAKRRASRYRPGRRTEDWLKVAYEHRRPFVIGGVTPGRNYGTGALLVGAYDPACPGLLTYLGHVGTGFDRQELRRVVMRLEPTRQCPFHAVPRDHRNATWVKPRVVCTVGYRQLTADRRLRHPVYRGPAPEIEPAACLVPWAAGE